VFGIAFYGSAMANPWGLPEELRPIFQKDPGYANYTLSASDPDTAQNQPEDWAFFLMSSRSHNELNAAMDQTGEGTGWALAGKSTTAVYQPGRAPSACMLGKGYIAYDGESYTFNLKNGSWQLIYARFALHEACSIVFESDGLYGYWFKSGTERVYWAESYISLLDFNIELMPKSLKAVRQMNNMRSILKRYGCFNTQLTGKRYPQRAAVYTAPSVNSFRSANGKAVVSLNDEVWVLGKTEGWYLVGYRVNSRTSRIGYIQAEGIDYDAYEMEFGHQPATLNEDSYITDDPWTSQSPIAELKAGTELDCLASFNPFYAYVETEIEGKAARGFVPLQALSPQKGIARDDLMKRLAGNWYIYSGGSMHADYLVFHENGTCIGTQYNWDAIPADGVVIQLEADMIASQMSGTWSVSDYDPSQKLFWNDPPYMITFANNDGTFERYGLSFHENGFGLSNFEGGGGFIRCK
jgi:hypothetical protein